ncbi:MAG: hypothetical protein JWO86_7707 [Myxococcaceae bacterium]|nr:hypothetical protein [Myxococcaceae bacterium]
MADESLFADMERDDDFELSDDAEDRAILHAIWMGGEIGDLPVQDGWRILFERYPDDVRLLAALLSEEIQQADMGSPEQVCGKLERILDAAKGKLDAEVRDLLAFARLDVDDDTKTGMRRKKPLSAATAKRVAGIRARVGESSGDVWEEGGPAARLAAFRAKLLRALHDQTIGNKPIRRGAARAPDSWKEMVAAAKTTKRYSATATYEVTEAVEHPKFGVGVVTFVEKGRVTVFFESGERKLVVKEE